MRVLGAVMMVFGFLFCLTVIGAVIGIPLMLIGLVLVLAGGSNRTVVVHVNQQNAPHYNPHPQPHYPHAQPHYPTQPTIPPLANSSGYDSATEPPPFPVAAPDARMGPS